jgi:hypothetical protein
LGSRCVPGQCANFLGESRAGEYQWLDSIQFHLNNYKGDEPPAVETSDAFHELPAFLARSTKGFTTWRYFHELWSQEGAIFVYEHRLLDHFCQAVRDEFERQLHERGATFPAQESR